MAINPKVIDIYHRDGVAPDGFVQARAFGILGVIHKASEGSATATADPPGRSIPLPPVGWYEPLAVTAVTLTWALSPPGTAT